MKWSREGNPTIDDIDEINQKCVMDIVSPPPGAQVATHANNNMDAINAAVFHDWTKNNKRADGTVLKAACVIFTDNLCMNDGSGTFVPVKNDLV